MNMETPVSGGELALPPNIDELVDGRNKAIELYGSAYDSLHATLGAAKASSIAAAINFGVGFARYDDSTENTSRLLRPDAREEFMKAVVADVDRSCWSVMMNRLGLSKLLDRQAQEEFRESLRETPPPFTVENCVSTFGNVWENRREMYLRGIANVFMDLDRRFRSHDAFAIGNRIIINHAMNEWGGWNNYNRRDTLHDVERIFLELDGKEPVAHDGGIVGDVEKRSREGDLPAVVEGPYFRVRLFKNGNLHLWFTNKKLLAEVNALLLEYYNPIEGDVAPDGPSYEHAPMPHKVPAKNHGAFMSTPEVAAKMLDRLDGDLKGLRVLEPSAGSGVLARAARDAGAQVKCVEIQHGFAHELALANFDTTQGDFLSMTPAELGKFDVILMNPPFDRGRDCDHVLHAFKFLRDGGQLVTVMSARAQYATDGRHKALHDLVKRATPRWGYSWSDLPDRSFASAGTNVNTVTLRLLKQ